jgi:hypothetical protein
MTEAGLVFAAIGVVVVVILVAGVMSNCAHWHDDKRRSGWR